jgi:tetratricopeptide (TPR) repeat protein
VTRADLEGERQFLLESIVDLDMQYEAGEISQDDYDALREDYTVRAAEVMRALEAYDNGEGEYAGEYDGVRDEWDDAGDEEEEPAARGRGGRTARHSSSRKVVALVVIAGMVLVTLLSVVTLFGGGSNPGGSGAAPSSIAQRLALAHQYEGQGQAVEALKQYDAVLKDDPRNVEALTYRGWLLKLAGLTDQAEEYLDRALEADPSYPDAHFFRGMLYFQDRGNPAAAIPEFETYLASNPPPETVQAVQGVLDQARQAAAGQPPPTSVP